MATMDLGFEIDEQLTRYCLIVLGCAVLGYAVGRGQKQSASSEGPRPTFSFAPTKMPEPTCQLRPESSSRTRKTPTTTTASPSTMARDERIRAGEQDGYVLQEDYFPQEGRRMSTKVREENLRTITPSLDDDGELVQVLWSAPKKEIEMTLTHANSLEIAPCLNNPEPSDLPPPKMYMASCPLLATPALASGSSRNPHATCEKESLAVSAQVTQDKPDFARQGSRSTVPSEGISRTSSISTKSEVRRISTSSSLQSGCSIERANTGSAQRELRINDWDSQRGTSPSPMSENAAEVPNAHTTEAELRMAESRILQTIDRIHAFLKSERRDAKRNAEAERAVAEVDEFCQLQPLHASDPPSSAQANICPQRLDAAMLEQLHNETYSHEIRLAEEPESDEQRSLAPEDRDTWEGESQESEPTVASESLMISTELESAPTASLCGSPCTVILRRVDSMHVCGIDAQSPRNIAPSDACVDYVVQSPRERASTSDAWGALLKGRAHDGMSFEWGCDTSGFLDCEQMRREAKELERNWNRRGVAQWNAFEAIEPQQQYPSMHLATVPNYGENMGMVSDQRCADEAYTKDSSLDLPSPIGIWSEVQIASLQQDVDSTRGYWEDHCYMN